MKTKFGAFPAVLLFLSVTHAQNMTVENLERAQAVIDAAVEAFGGTEKLSGLTSVVIESTSNFTAVDQSVKPEPPWDVNVELATTSIDFEKQLFVNRNKHNEGNYDFGNIINGDDSYEINFLAGTATPVIEADFNTVSGPTIRITSTLLVHQLMQRAHTARYMGEATINQRKHDVISFAMEVGPAISLYFDQQTHRLSKSERVIPNYGLVEYIFDDYKTVDGILFNGRYKFILRGDEGSYRVNTAIKTNQDIESSTRLHRRIKKLKRPEPDEFRTRELANGVYHVGGEGTYALFVEMQDYIVAIGGTGGSEERIAALRGIVADKPIKYAVMTHHHADHVFAAPSYMAENATFLVAPTHENIVRTAADSAEVAIETVSNSKTLSDGRRELQIIDIGPTDHTEHLLVAYLPKERILFSADHLPLPVVGPMIPAGQATKDLAAALEQRKLAPKQFATAHSRRIGSPKDLRSALSRKRPKID